MSISPKTALLLNLVVGVLLLLGSGTLYRPSFLTDAWSKDIVGMAGSGAVIMNLVLHLFAAPAAGPAAGGDAVPASRPLSLVLVAAALTVFLVLSGRPADAALLTSKFNLNELMTKLAAANLADLDAAIQDANGTGDVLATTCYPKIRDLVAAMKKSSETVNLPKVHIFLTFQHGRDVANAIRPGSAINVACAPLALEVKMDFVTFIGAIAGGTLSAASFGL